MPNKPLTVKKAKDSIDNLLTMDKTPDPDLRLANHERKWALVTLKTPDFSPLSEFSVGIKLMLRAELHQSPRSNTLTRDNRRYLQSLSR